MAEPFANTGFDPLFGDPLRRLIEKAKAEGLNASILSGVRDDETQRQLVANAAATRAGRPLPYPDRGLVRMAAPVGQSPHEYGVAGDVSGIPQAELSRLAPPLGLNTIPGDPGHVELANWRQVAANQAPPTPWSDVPNVPSSYAENASAPIAPGTNINTTSPFLLTLQRFESGGRNIPNTHQGTSSGQAQGYDQITTGTWDEFGGKKFAISPLQATYDQQNAIAANIPMKRWAPETLSYLKNEGFKVDPSQTLGQNIAANAGISARASTGPIGSDAVAGGTAGEKAPMTWGDWFNKITAPGAGGAQSPLQKSLGDVEKGLEPQQQGGQQAPQQNLQAEQAAAPIGQARQQSLSGQARQLMAQILAQSQKPLSWGSAPPGANIGPSMGLGAGQVPPPPMMAGGAPSMADEQLAMLMQQGAPGTTLNSMGGPYG